MWTDGQVCNGVVSPSPCGLSSTVSRSEATYTCILNDNATAFYVLLELEYSGETSYYTSEIITL
ncbi:hypothetical protein B6U74_05420 [Candidatus Bathyarchaeota archaeon ex4484_205]|nr:MAG: hypothetical protein B6U74_05420 [Candidatus Bathyarchaeota archaeon ex4484_205]